MSAVGHDSGIPVGRRPEMMTTNGNRVRHCKDQRLGQPSFKRRVDELGEMKSVTHLVDQLLVQEAPGHLPNESGVKRRERERDR